MPLSGAKGAEWTWHSGVGHGYARAQWLTCKYKKDISYVIHTAIAGIMLASRSLTIHSHVVMSLTSPFSVCLPGWLAVCLAKCLSVRLSLPLSLALTLSLSLLSLSL